MNNHIGIQYSFEAITLGPCSEATTDITGGPKVVLFLGKPIDYATSGEQNFVTMTVISEK